MDDNFNIPGFNDMRQEFTTNDRAKILDFLNHFFASSDETCSSANCCGLVHIENFIKEGLLRMGLKHLLVFDSYCTWTFNFSNTKRIQKLWGGSVLNKKQNEISRPWLYGTIKKECLAYINSNLNMSGDIYYIAMNYTFDDKNAQIAYMRKYKLERMGI